MWWFLMRSQNKTPCQGTGGGGDTTDTLPQRSWPLTAQTESIWSQLWGRQIEHDADTPGTASAWTKKASCQPYSWEMKERQVAFMVTLFLKGWWRDFITLWLMLKHFLWNVSICKWGQASLLCHVLLKVLPPVPFPPFTASPRSVYLHFAPNGKYKKHIWVYSPRTSLSRVGTTTGRWRPCDHQGWGDGRVMWLWQLMIIKSLLFEWHNEWHKWYNI